MKVIKNIANLVTVASCSKPLTGKNVNNIEIIENGYLVISDGKFIEVGSGDGYQKYLPCEVIDATGKTVTPGLIDCHTHLVHAGSREHELAMKLSGYSYLDILASGGGILNTVTKTRNASFEELYEKAKNSLDIMLKHGTTVVEAKSGYGLDIDTEIKQMEVVKKINNDHPITLISTFMGAHATPPEYKDKKDEYIALVKSLINRVKAEDLAQFVDVFCEEGVFSVSEAKDILEYAKNQGLQVKIHADEIMPLGGAKLAVDLKAISAEHLIASSDEDLISLAQSKVIAVMLPLTSFNLNKSYLKARLILDNDGILAIATDYNPGSSPSENIQLAMQVAALQAKLTPKEVIAGVTINAATALGIEKKVGSIEVGKLANFVIFDVANLDYLIYHFGINHVQDVYIKGELVVDKQTIRR